MPLQITKPRETHTRNPLHSNREKNTFALEVISVDLSLNVFVHRVWSETAPKRPDVAMAFDLSSVVFIGYSLVAFALLLYTGKVSRLYSEKAGFLIVVRTSAVCLPPLCGEAEVSLHLSSFLFLFLSLFLRSCFFRFVCRFVYGSVALFECGSVLCFRWFAKRCEGSLPPFHFSRFPSADY